MNTIGQNNNIAFNGVMTRKLSADEMRRVKDISYAYDEIMDCLSVFNGADTTKFKQRFPDLYRGKQGKGFLFHDGDDKKSPLYHVFKFSAEKPMGMKFIKGEDIVSCRFSEDTLTMYVDDDYKGKFGIEKVFANLLETVGKEIAFLKEYSEFYPKIKAKLSVGNLKSVIARLISEVKPQTNKLNSDIEQILKDYSNLNEKLNGKHKDVSLRLKEAYFGKDVQKGGKELTFRDDKGKLVFAPLKSKYIDSVFRLRRFDKNDNIQYAIVAFADGTIARAKNLEKYEDIRSNNLEQVSDMVVEELGLKSDFKLLSEHFSKFGDFIEDYASKYKLVKGKNKKVKSFEEIELKKAEKERMKKVKQEMVELFKAQKAQNAEIKRAEREAAKQEKKRQKEILKAEKAEERKRFNVAKLAKAAEKKLKQQKIKEKKKTEHKKVRYSYPQFKEIEISQDDKKIFLGSSLKGLNILQLTKKLDSIFATPVEKRTANLSHELMSNGKIFAGRFFTITEDGSKISVTKMKSPRYVDFLYYSIKLEKDGKTTFLNIDPSTQAIIASSSDGKPILKGATITYNSKEKSIKDNPTTDEIPLYLRELLFSAKKGKVVKTVLKQQAKPQNITEEDICRIIKSFEDDENSPNFVL